MNKLRDRLDFDFISGVERNSKQDCSSLVYLRSKYSKKSRQIDVINVLGSMPITK